MALLRAPGRPLDPGARSFFEPRFGRGFGDVRLHEGERAAASARGMGALAYATGHDIVLGAPYSRGSPFADWVLAHELAHVVQQERGGAPAIQPLKVTPGDYGIALEWFTQTAGVPDDVTRLLKRSPTFMAMAQTLDRKYLALENPRTDPNWHTLWEPKNGVLTKGPFAGRRVLAIWNNQTGSMFESAGALTNKFGYDIINIAPKSRLQGQGVETGGYLEDIAHETTHAFTFVTGSGPAPADVAAGIRAAIAEEGSTRKTEQKIIGEAQVGAGKALAGYTPKGGSTEAAGIERDFFPGKLRATYLESFVMDALLRRAIAKDGLTPEMMEEGDREVDAIKLEDESLDTHLTDPFPLFFDRKSGMYQTLSGDYRKFRFWQRVMDARWKRFLEDNQPGGRGFEAARERVLQEHAAAFFEGVISYTPLP